MVEAHRAGILEDRAIENAFGPLTLAAVRFIPKRKQLRRNFFLVLDEKWVTSVLVRHCHRQIDHREQHENESLNERNGEVQTEEDGRHCNRDNGKPDQRE